MGKQLGLLEEPLLTVKEVAVILNVSEETVRRYARDRVLTTVDIPGGAIRFHRKTLNDELNELRQSFKAFGVSDQNSAACFGVTATSL